MLARAQSECPPDDTGDDGTSRDGSARVEPGVDRPEWDVDTRFGGRMVHGALVAGLIRAAVSRFPGTVIDRAQDLEFLAPVRVTAETVVVETLATGSGPRSTDPHRHCRGRGSHRRHAPESHLLPAGGAGGRFRRRLTAARSEDSSVSRSSASTASAVS